MNVHGIEFTHRRPFSALFKGDAKEFSDFANACESSLVAGAVKSVFFDTSSHSFVIEVNETRCSQFDGTHSILLTCASDTLLQHELFGQVGHHTRFDSAKPNNKLEETNMIKPNNFSDFEMMTSKRFSGGSAGHRPGGFAENAEPLMRISLHRGSQTSKGEPGNRQLCVSLNKKVMELARYTAGDRVNVFFNKDRSIMALERHPTGEFSLSPKGATKEERKAAVGKPYPSDVKFTGPEWMQKTQKLQTSVLVCAKDIAIEGSRIMAQVNLLA
ncbi:MAG: hypothetical protein HQ446_01315 [Polaromonas sp.]|nr:hypothetical protein [Polaromonas sp.]